MQTKNEFHQINLIHDLSITILKINDSAELYATKMSS